MMIAMLQRSLVLAAVLGFVAVSTENSARAQTPVNMPDSDIVAGGLDQRLASLMPSDPMAYFELAEELAIEADDIAATQLAQHLYVLSFELARTGGNNRLAASACLGLAELSRLDRERRWLLALAGIVDPARGNRVGRGRSADGATLPTFDAATGLRAAEVLGEVRAGNGRQASELLESDATRRVLERYSVLLGRPGGGSSMNRIESHARDWPDNRCFGQRVVKERSTGQEVVIDRCPHCGGNPGPDLSIVELVGHLRFESHLLNGVQRSWSAQLWADGGAPLRDPEPDDLAPAFRIDPAKAEYRGGEWVEPDRSQPNGLGSPTDQSPSDQTTSAPDDQPPPKEPPG